MARKTAASILFIFLFSTAGFGSLNVSLPELQGSYSWTDGFDKELQMDFTSVPFEIGSVSLHLKGNVQPGTILIGGNEQTPMIVYPSIVTAILNLSGMSPNTIWATDFTPPSPYESFQFDIEMEYDVPTFEGNPEHSYTFGYLNGKQLPLYLMLFFGVNTNDTLQTAPAMQITEAEMSINPTPEPATLLLLGLGGLILRKK